MRERSGGPGPGARLVPECARLVETLRELRARTGLSLAGLADATSYSKSSWERYLNGKSLPPRQAVEALCRVAGEPAGRPVALWELADAVWSGRSLAGSPGTAPTPPTPPAAPEHPAPSPSVRRRQPWQPRQLRQPRQPRRPWALAGLGALVCVLAFALTLLLWPEPGEDAAPRAKTGPEVAVGCAGPACTGQDPVQMRCGAGETPRTLRTVRPKGRLLDIRYQSRCSAAWVRMWGQRVGDRVEVTAPGVPAQSEVIDDAYETGQRRSTPMAAVGADGPSKVRACLVRKEGGRECFTATVHPR